MSAEAGSVVATESRVDDSLPPLVTALACLAVVWQLVVVSLAFHHAPAVLAFITALNLQPGLITSAFLASYRWWPLVVLVSVLVMVISLRGRRRSTGKLIAAVIIPVIIAVGLEVWTLEAALAPIYAAARVVR